MNKKQFVGAAALTAVVVAGVVYYRWITSTGPFAVKVDELSPEMEAALDRFDEAPHTEPMEKPHG